MWSWLMSLLFRSSSHAEAQTLRKKINETVIANERASHAALSFAEHAETDTTKIETISEATRERLALLDAQRRLRNRNPTVTTATEALKLIERRQ